MAELQWEETQKKLCYFMLQQDGQEFMELKMIEHNQIPGLVPMCRQYIDEQICFSYHVQGYDALQKILEQRTVSVKWACRILREIITVMLAGEAYFLSREAYCISAEYIYLDRGRKEVLLCYLPGSGQDVYREFRNLLETFMERLDHRDKKETAFFYDLYDMFSAEEVSLDELQEHLYLYGQEKHKRGQDEQKEGEKEETHPAQNTQRHRKKGVWHTDNASEEETVRYFLLYQGQNGCDTERQNVKIVPSRLVLETGQYRIGRLSGQDIVLLPGQISRSHATLEVERQQVYLTDQGSVNGTFVNGRKISACVKTRLHAGDMITFADISYRLHIMQDAVRADSGKEKNKRIRPNRRN